MRARVEMRFKRCLFLRGRVRFFFARGCADADEKKRRASARTRGEAAAAPRHSRRGPRPSPPFSPSPLRVRRLDDGRRGGAWRRARAPAAPRRSAAATRGGGGGSGGGRARARARATAFFFGLFEGLLPCEVQCFLTYFLWEKAARARRRRGAGGGAAAAVAAAAAVSAAIAAGGGAAVAAEGPHPPDARVAGGRARRGAARARGRRGRSGRRARALGSPTGPPPAARARRCWCDRARRWAERGPPRGWWHR